MNEFKRLNEYFEKYKLKVMYLEMFEYCYKKEPAQSLEVLNHIYDELDKGSLLIPESIKILLSEKMPVVIVSYYRYLKAKKFIEEEL